MHQHWKLFVDYDTVTLVVFELQEEVDVQARNLQVTIIVYT